MKKILGIIVLSLLLSTSTFSANKNVGKGEVTLSSLVVQNFIKYIKGGYGNKPGSFWITIDGNNPYYWTCGEGSCQSSGRERVSERVRARERVRASKRVRERERLRASERG